jgi:predicted CoA-substrate-specific enzyme activase
MFAGLDVGSRTVKLVTLRGAVQEFSIAPTGVNPVSRCLELIGGRKFEGMVATGYGRHLVAAPLGASSVTEIKAFTLGARQLFHDSSSVIDIGGQDCKVIQLGEHGEVRKFEMNDRCAAGTGRFLEVMADTLEVPVSRIGELALRAEKELQINNLCTVFAESEVVSLIGRGEQASSIALALHRAIISRVASMAQRVGVKGKVVFAGGAALNICLVRLLGEQLNIELVVPKQPQLVGALGAALLAQRDAGG